MSDPAPSIFISLAQGDGETFTTDLRPRLERATQSVSVTGLRPHGKSALVGDNRLPPLCRA